MQFRQNRLYFQMEVNHTKKFYAYMELNFECIIIDIKTGNRFFIVQSETIKSKNTPFSEADCTYPEIGFVHF